jgi:hypothetical protein
MGRAGIASAAAVTALLVFYTVLAFVILDPNAVYSGDIGVKYVQARALASHHFTSLAISYPGAALDPEGMFFPMRAPFVLGVRGQVQAIFPPAAAIVQAAAVGAGGIGGLAVVSLAGAAVILCSAVVLAPARQRLPVIFTLGLASPLWFYAVSGWEHAIAIGFSTAAFACAISRRTLATPLLAGVLLGLGATQRDEVILLLPGLVLLLSWRSPSWSAVGAVVGGAIAVLLVAAAIDVWCFQRPAAAHLRHAVHLLQSALRLTNEANPELPQLEPFTAGQRYETVVQFWLLGYGNDRWIAIYAAGLAIALAIWRWSGSSIGSLVWITAVLVLAASDLRELAAAPKWLAGLLRVSPFIAVVVLPPAHGSAPRRWLHVPLLLTTLGYLVLAYIGADTTGGKSLGPRLLLPLLPLLSVIAIATIAEYLAAPRWIDRGIGAAGVALVLVSAGSHLLGTIPAYIGRNHGDAAAIAAIRSSYERIVVVDDVFTAQLMFPLYYRKIILLADERGRAGELGRRLAEQGFGPVLLVSRADTPPVSLPPLTRVSVERQGRMTLEHWRR